MNFQEFLSHSYLDNTVSGYLKTVGSLIGGLVCIWIIKSVVIRRLKALAEKTVTKIDDALVNLIERFIVPIFYFVVLYLSVVTLHLSPGLRKGLVVMGAGLSTYFFIRFLLGFIRFFIFDVYVPKKENRADLGAHLRSLMPALSILVWGTGIIFLLDNLGFNISALMAGLGIGGVAVALAGAAVLGDLFAYVSIMLDKPFVLGDFLIVGDFLGSVQHIGIKTTRLRSLGGEQVIFSNKDLTDSRIRNYKRMDQRRVLFKLGVTYDTALSQMKEIPGMIEKIIKNVQNTTFDRAHFSAYGDFNLVIEIVYYVRSKDYNTYMNIQQTINFGIKEEFEKKKIEFAFPTQTLHLVKPS